MFSIVSFENVKSLAIPEQADQVRPGRIHTIFVTFQRTLRHAAEFSNTDSNRSFPYKHTANYISYAHISLQTYNIFLERKNCDHSPPFKASSDYPVPVWSRRYVINAFSRKSYKLQCSFFLRSITLDVTIPIFLNSQDISEKPYESYAQR